MSANAQDGPSLKYPLRAEDSLVKQKDIRDVIAVIFNKKPDPVKDSIKANKKFQFSLLPAIGYTLQTRLAAIIAGNVAFHTQKDSLQKISSVYFNVAYTQNKQFTVPIQSNIWTKNNKYNFVGDWRYMKYPQDTYGLGGNNSLANDANLIDYSYIRIYQTVFKKIAGDLYGGVGYNMDYYWNIKEDGYSDGRKSDYEMYGNQKKSFASGFSLSALFDDRENSINPLNGQYANIVYRNNLTALGSNENWQSLVIDLRKYITVNKRRQNVLALWFYNWNVLSGKPPYLLLPATAWDTYTNTGRGFIQGRFRSKYMVYLESEYRFRITDNGLLGGVVFVNAQSLSEWDTNKFEYVQPAAGLGLRVKLNKQSKTNIDIDYGFGKGGSRGLFINVGEIF